LRSAPSAHEVHPPGRANSAFSLFRPKTAGSTFTRLELDPPLAGSPPAATAPPPPPRVLHPQTSRGTAAPRPRPRHPQATDLSPPPHASEPSAAATQASD